MARSASTGHGALVMHRLVQRLLVVCLGILVALGVYGGVQLASTSCNPLAQSACVRVLFIGNSYTYVNDLPTVFRDLARAAGQNVETSMVANGGETLAQHAASDDDRTAIGGTHWQYVVLQEQSEIPSVETFRQTGMYPAARSLVASIRADGATADLSGNMGSPGRLARLRADVRLDAGGDRPGLRDDRRSAGRIDRPGRTGLAAGRDR